jgi:hypothetical protein
MSTSPRPPCCDLAYHEDASRINAAIVSGQAYHVTAAIYELDETVLLTHVKHLADEGWPTEQSTETPVKQQETPVSTLHPGSLTLHPGSLTLADRLAAFRARAAAPVLAASAAAEAATLPTDDEEPAKGQERPATAQAERCCALGDHPKVDALNAEILAGDLSVRVIAGRYGTNPTAIQRHKPHIGAAIPHTTLTSTPAALGHVTPAAPPVAPAPTTPPAPTLVAPATVEIVAQPTRQEPGQPAAMGTGMGTERSNETVVKQSEAVVLDSRNSPENSMKQGRALQDPNRAANEAARKLLESQIKMIADLVALGQWRDRPTVLGLAERWKMPEEEVERLYAIAAGRVRANRGTTAAQLEVAVAFYKDVRDKEMAYAKDCDAAAVAAYNARKFPDAKHGKMLAQMARKTAFDAQKQIDAVTIAKAQALTIQVSVLADPDFAGAMRIVAFTLDELESPGAARRVEKALEAFDSGGEVAARQWIKQEKTRKEVTLTASADGTFSMDGGS